MSTQTPRPTELDRVSVYVESPADAAMTQFLASVTPGQVLAERGPLLNVVERRISRYLVKKSVAELVSEYGSLRGVTETEK